MVLNLRVIAATLSALVGFLGVSMLFPALVGLWYGESAWISFAVTGAVSLVAGAVGRRAWRTGERDEVRVREGFAIVALSWFVLTAIGCIPFVTEGVLSSYTDAFFEVASGFTTTGSSVLGGAHTPAIEEIPKAFLFWRSLTHWIGGMGIIVLTLAVLPILGVGGMQLYKAEAPGPSTDKLTPRVRETAKRLWLIYVGITAAQVLMLLPSMDLFDAVNHAFATMATGGFSTKNASVLEFGSAYADWVITAFMFLAGTNFALHFRMLRGRPITVFRDTEFRVYVAIVVVSSLALALASWGPVLRVLPLDVTTPASFTGYPGFFESLRYAAFQAVSIITTTGFVTADYEVWPPLAIGILFTLFFIGGMAGSTAGGVKVIRHVLLFKNSQKEVRQLIHPQAVLTVRLNDGVVPQDVMRNVLSFAVMYLGLIGVGTLAVAGSGVDLLSAFMGVVSCVANIGPALGSLGPMENYAHIPDVGKWVLSFLMIAGRLEIFTVMILFAPSFWRR